MKKNEFEVVVHNEYTFRVYAETEEEAMLIARNANNNVFDNVQEENIDECALESMRANQYRVNGKLFLDNDR